MPGEERGATMSPPIGHRHHRLDVQLDVVVVAASGPYPGLQHARRLFQRQDGCHEVLLLGIAQGCLVLPNRHRPSSSMRSPRVHYLGTPREREVETIRT